MLVVIVLYFYNLREKAWYKHWDALVLSYLDLATQTQDNCSPVMLGRGP
jgi:hypothetical protein